jgi:hypothetical protein
MGGGTCGWGGQDRLLNRKSGDIRRQLHAVQVHPTGPSAADAAGSGEENPGEESGVFHDLEEVAVMDWITTEQAQI